jgi:beta-1,4-mannosyl-glycoprotein beta-1,4-N-acetylglucosaminyltransferase
MKIFDIFPFFNELDLLEIRLNILNPYVDYFVLSESTKTFSGLDKPLYYGENKKKFSKFNHKIIHNIIDQDASKEDLLLRGKKYNTQIEAQQRDTYQKDLIKNIVLQKCNKDDIFIWSDLDEIPNPQIIKNINDFFVPNSIFHLAQKNYLGYLNLLEVSGNIKGMTDDFLPDENEQKKWLGSKIIDFNIFEKYTFTQLRNYIREANNYRISNGGWHWSYVGSEGLDINKRIMKKIECAAHTEYNNDNIKSYISRIDENKDPLGRNYTEYIIETIDDSFPQYIIDNINKFDYLIKKI